MALGLYDGDEIDVSVARRRYKKKREEKMYLLIEENAHRLLPILTIVVALYDYLDTLSNGSEVVCHGIEHYYC